MNTSSADTPGHRKHEQDPPRAEEISFRGIPASPGIAIASCVVIAGEQHDEVRVVVVPEENRAAEHVRYDEALAACIENLRSTYLLAEREIGNVRRSLARKVLKDFPPVLLAFDGRHQFGVVVRR